jgi:hypothetical protein
MDSTLTPAWFPARCDGELAMNTLQSRRSRAGIDSIDHAGVEGTLDATMAEIQRLHRTNTRLRRAAAAGLVVAAARLVAALRLGVGQVVLLELAVAVVLALTIYALVQASRIGARLEALRQEIFTLRFLRDVLAHEGGPTALYLGHPYRARTATSNAARDHAAGNTRDQPASTDADKRPFGWAITWRPILGTALLSVIAGLGVLALAWLGTGKSSTEPRTWMFLEDVTDPRSLGFHTPTAAAGEWVLQFHEDATGARALVNLAGAPAERPATAVVDRPSPRDLQLGARCKVSPDRPEQACGVVFRYQDHGNHYVARVDAAAAVVTLGVVVDGIERLIHAEAADIGTSRWHDLAVQARADHIVVTWNGSKVIDVRDPTLSSQGAVGLWAPADCVAYFDELTVQALPAVLTPAELLLFML